MATNDPTELLSPKTGLSTKTPKVGPITVVDGQGNPDNDPTVLLSGNSASQGAVQGQLPSRLDIGGEHHSMQRLGYDSFKSYEEYLGTVKTDLSHPDPVGLNYSRAKAQGTGEQLWTKAYQLVPNIGMGILETVGYLGDFQNYMGMMGIIETNYDNWLSESMRKGREAVQEWDPIYREHPQQVWNPADPAWWIDHVGDLTESIVEFGVTGWGVGASLKAGAKALGMMAAAGRFGTTAAGVAGKTSMGLQKGSQLITAASLAYSEGVMVGINVYDTDI